MSTGVQEDSSKNESIETLDRNTLIFEAVHQIAGLEAEISYSETQEAQGRLHGWHLDASLHNRRQHISYMLTLIETEGSNTLKAYVNDLKKDIQSEIDQERVDLLEQALKRAEARVQET